MFERLSVIVFFCFRCTVIEQAIIPATSDDHFKRFWPILFFFANFATIKNFFQKSKCTHHPRTGRHVFAKFDVLRRLSRLSLEISFKEKQSPTHSL